MTERRVHLPVVGSLGPDGRRVRIVPADVRGRFVRARRVVFAVLLALGLAMPMIQIGGRPAVFLDVPARRFFLFGTAFNAQDGWLAFFALTGVGFAIVVLTSTFGRAFCGWACPQTVLLEGLFRPVERAIEGKREARLRRDAGPPTLERMLRKVAKHGAFALIALLVAHLVLAYFVSMPSLGTMILEGRAAHPVAFAWMLGVGVALYVHGALFREQLCLIVCPYGRLQSVLTDDDTLVIGYDARRGEPRGKGRERTDKGDCVDCGRCVAVCPTGIDIRDGMQIDCIQCAQCIDACDEVMARLGRPAGLVRYDSLRGLRGERRRWWRPRLALHVVLAGAGACALGLAVHLRQPFEANLLRAPGPPFVLDGDVVRNTLEIHVVSKLDRPSRVAIAAVAFPDGAAVDVVDSIELGPLASGRATVVVRIPRARFRPRGRLQLRVGVEDASRLLEAPLLGPIGAVGPRRSPPASALEGNRRGP